MKGPITRSRASRERKGHDCTDLSKRGVVVAVVDTFLVIVIVELCGELWLRPMSKDLFSARVRRVIVVAPVVSRLTVFSARVIKIL